MFQSAGLVEVTQEEQTSPDTLFPRLQLQVGTAACWAPFWNRSGHLRSARRTAASSCGSGGEVSKGHGRRRRYAGSREEQR